MKNFFIALGGLVLLFVLAAILIPLVVDVDKFRPQVTQAADERINGKLELGKLSLSLWGQIRVEVGGIKLTDTQGREVIAVKDAFFHVPFSSLFSGAPILTLKMVAPEMFITKNKLGKLNVMSLVKSTPATTASGPGGTPVPTASTVPSQVTLPGIATRARLGIEVQNAVVNYKDELSGMTTQVRDLNLVVHDLSLSRPTDLELWANLDTQVGKTLTVRGPAKVTGKAVPEMNQGRFEQLAVTLDGDFDGLEILMPGLFEKKRGVTARLGGNIKVTPQEARIERLDAKFFNAEIKSTGTISNLDAKPGAQASAPIVKLSLKSNEIELKPWNELIPLLREYELAGSATLDANAEGPSDLLNYQANLAVKSLTAKAGKLKAQPTINAQVHIVTDQIDKFLVTMKAPANDLSVTGKVVSFSHPHASFQVTSSGMDLDQLVEFPPPRKKGEAAPVSGPAGAQTGSATAQSAVPAADYDALLEPLRSNPMMAQVTANIGVDIKLLKAYGVKMTDIQSRISFKELIASIEQFTMAVWSGAVRANAAMQLKPKTPSYHFNAEVSGMDLQQAVASQLELFKNTVIGKATFKMDGTGESFNPEPAKKNLNAKGTFKVERAVFATIDVGKMASEALNKAIERASEKIPPLKGKGVKTIPGKDSRYESISSSFGLAGGKFSAPDFLAKPEVNQGIGLKGATTVGMIDYSLKADWEIEDTYNLTHARDLSVDINGTHVEHILAEGDRPVHFPVSAGCTVFAPCYTYAQVPEYLAKVAVNNVTQAATGKLKSEAKKKVEEKVRDVTRNAPPAVQDAVKNLGKKFFGH